jgi:hypothetical protein
MQVVLARVSTERCIDFVELKFPNGMHCTASIYLLNDDTGPTPAVITGLDCRHCGLDPQSHITKLHRAGNNYENSVN